LSPTLHGTALVAAFLLAGAGEFFELGTGGRFVPRLRWLARVDVDRLEEPEFWNALDGDGAIWREISILGH